MSLQQKEKHEGRVFFDTTEKNKKHLNLWWKLFLLFHRHRIEFTVMHLNNEKLFLHKECLQVKMEMFCLGKFAIFINALCYYCMLGGNAVSSL